MPPSVDVPRLEPPPPSLEAMVASGRREPTAAAGSRWLLWVLLLVVALGVTAYVAR